MKKLILSTFLPGLLIVLASTTGNAQNNIKNTAEVAPVNKNKAVAPTEMSEIQVADRVVRNNSLKVVDEMLKPKPPRSTEAVATPVNNRTIQTENRPYIKPHSVK